MANAIKRVARSRRSHRGDKNFGRFIWNAHKKAEEKFKIDFGHMLAEEMEKNREENEKKENE